MAVKQDFAKQLESQIAVWQAQIKAHQEKMAQRWNRHPNLARISASARSRTIVWR